MELRVRRSSQSRARRDLGGVRLDNVAHFHGDRLTVEPLHAELEAGERVAERDGPADDEVRAVAPEHRVRLLLDHEHHILQS
jgi:hypothetical protein